jgi:hypothetical protein
MRSEICCSCPDVELRSQNPNESFTHFPENGSSRLHSGEHGEIVLRGMWVVTQAVDSSEALPDNTAIYVSPWAYCLLLSSER